MFPPFLPNLFALVLAFNPPNAGPFVAAVTAELVVTNAVVEICKGNVGGLVAFVLAVEAR